MRQDFEVFTIGLFTVPVNIPGTPFYRSMQAREKIQAVVEGEPNACMLDLLCMCRPFHHYCAVNGSRAPSSICLMLIMCVQTSFGRHRE